MKTLSLHLHKELSPALGAVIGVCFFAFATALGAYVRIPLPFTPVPITLQTFFVVLAGACLGRTRGATSQSLYVGLGMLGMPVFTGTALGLGYILGPTGGYLIGFVLAAFVVGKLFSACTETPSFIRSAGIMGLGIAIIYACGMMHLMYTVHASLRTAIVAGALPFVIGDICKVCAAAAVYKACRAYKIAL
jgi:biotin transport system substrate-specific component